MILAILLTIIAGYLLGNINGAILISTHVLHDDIRTHGSGNAGMTNFMRTYHNGKLLFCVILIDVCKCVLSCVIGNLLLGHFGHGIDGRALGGAACMLGHAYPVFFGFKGGKMVLCAGALALCMNWWSALIALSMFFVVVLATNYVSLGSIVAVITWACFCIVLYWGYWFVDVVVLIMAILVVLLHRGNIGRLIHGTERKTYLIKPKH